MTLPPLTPQQRQAALDKALAARRERAEARKALKRGELTLTEVLDSPSHTLRKMPVLSLLTSLPGIGKTRAQKILTELNIPGDHRLRCLGPRQRARLCAHLAPKN
ncbi:integration host factor [Streptomyces sp. NBC_01456]|uniref:integration host factor, actinobacterial type n=1 Tax=unclassified Streptomyces TaxID=2593676 RepID=UPI002E2F18B7|nr:MULTISPECIES: integration host factor, actinobacterial type [unclassified Streptomyces]